MRRPRIRRPRAWGSGSREWDASLAPALYEELPVGVIAAGRDGENLVFNRRARELFEGTGEDLDPDDCADHYVLYTAEGDRLLRAEEIPLQRALRGERIADAVLTVQPKRGARRMVNVSAGPVAGRGGRLVGAVVVIHDVTERLGREDELRFQSAIAEHMAEAVILIRAQDGEILYVNQTTASMFGYRREELVGEPIARLNVPTDRAPAARAAEILDGLAQDGVWSGEIEHVRRDGSEFWCSVSVSPFEHPVHGTVWTSVHTDVTARRAADAALRDAEERFRGVFEDSPVGIALVGSDFRLSDANPALCAITGFTRDELVGRSFEQIAHPDDPQHDRELARRALAGEIRLHRAEARFITKRGTVVRVAQTATAVRGPDDRPAGGLVIVDPLGDG
jgi:PAS domain S-box-containing protein